MQRQALIVGCFNINFECSGSKRSNYIFFGSKKRREMYRCLAWLVTAVHAEAVAAATFPKQIWSFWHQPELPRLVQLAVASWRTYAPDYEVKVINLQNYQQHVQGEDYHV